MTIAKDLAQLGKLVAARHGWPAAKAFKAYELGTADRATLARCATDLLKVFPQGPDSGAPMTAAFAVQLAPLLAAPVHVVAGTLSVEGEPVIGDRAAFDGPAIFGATPPDWHGHLWVMVGPYVADIAIFRSAYSRWGPEKLVRHVDLAFGPGKGLYVDGWQRTRQQGLGYEPHYVLSEDEVNRLMGRAYDLIKAERVGTDR